MFDYAQDLHIKSPGHILSGSFGHEFRFCQCPNADEGNVVSRQLPLRSTATLAASPDMSLTPVAPFPVLRLENIL